jgi:hypothetical protein
MSSYKDKLECQEYVPPCILDELERLNIEIEILYNHITRLQNNKVERTPIAPEPPQKDTDISYKDAVGRCPLGLPDPPNSPDN